MLGAPKPPALRGLFAPEVGNGVGGEREPRPGVVLAEAIPTLW